MMPEALNTRVRLDLPKFTHDYIYIYDLISPMANNQPETTTGLCPHLT
jgi:hypothetical protein